MSVAGDDVARSPAVALRGSRRKPLKWLREDVVNGTLDVAGQEFLVVSSCYATQPGTADAG